MEEKIINKIEDVEVGDIAYFEGVENGARVVSLDPYEEGSRLKVETPEEFKPFNLWAFSSVWLRDSFFRYAIRQTQKKPEEEQQQ